MLLKLAITDWLSLLSTFLLTCFVAAISHKKQLNNIKDYVLMGRQLSLPLFIATLCASWYGGIIGVTQTAYNHGLYSFLTQGIFWYLAYLTFALGFVKIIRKHQVLSLKQLIEIYLGSNTAKFSIICMLIKTLPITYSISLGILIKMFLPISLPLAIALGLVFVAAYAAIGGFRAIVYTDAIQFLLMLISIFIVVICSIYNYGGISFLKTNVPKELFFWHGNLTPEYSFIWLWIAFSTTFINPTFYQRCLAAKSDFTAISGILIAMLIWIIFDLCTTCGALYARAVIPNADPCNAYLTYSLQILPTGFKGIFLGSLFAIVLSTLDSFLFTCANIIAFDSNILKSITNFKIKTKLSILIIAVLTFIIALQVGSNFESVWRLLKGGYASCLLLPLIWGLLWPNSCSDRQYLISMSVSLIFTFFLPDGINFYIASSGILISLAVFSIINKIMQLWPGAFRRFL